MIEITHYPSNVFLEKGIFQQSVNFELRCHNSSKHSALLERFSAKGFDENGNSIFSLFVDSNAMAPSVETIPERKIESGETLEIFNPIATLPLEYDFTRMDFSLRFISEDATNVKAGISVKPVAYEQKVLLDLPFKETCLVTDGHDLFAHHRRLPLLNQYVKKMGFTSNSDRFGYDFMVADSRGGVYKSDGLRLEDYYGWGKPVIAPGDGRIVSASCDKLDNRIAVSLGNFSPEHYEELRKKAFERLGEWGSGDFHGNHVIIDHGNDEFSLIAHMQKDSVRLDVGDEVRRGKVLGNIGNSGDSWAPHIHYGLQNGVDSRSSDGLPSRFRDFELLLGNSVKRIENLCPNTGMVVRQ